jgi:acyl dehydratase
VREVGAQVTSEFFVPARSEHARSLDVLEAAGGTPVALFTAHRIEREAARAAGFRNVVAPPMFAVVYSAGAMSPAILDPEIGINLMLMVHGGQEFVWGEPVCAGDTITTETEVKDISEKDGKGYYVFESVSTNQDGQEVVRGLWTNIVR